MISRYPIGLVALVVATALVAWRALRLGRLIRTGRPSATPLPSWRAIVVAELSEVLGQRKLLSRRGAGSAHAAVFWGLLVLLLTVIEAIGALFAPRFALPLIGHDAVVGFIEDFFACAVLLGLGGFSVVRVRERPARRGRGSRFFGSHLAQAWLILLMIGAVITSLLIYRAAQVNAGQFPYGDWAFASHGIATLLHPLGAGTNGTMATVFLDPNVVVIAAFLVLVAYSKHLHIALAPINIALARHPVALGSLATTPDLDPETFDEDTVIGAGAIEHFSRKQLLDLPTCTECGRCQDACPAWATGKSLSPKLVIMSLRDELDASAPRLLGAPRWNRPTRTATEDAAPVARALVPDVLGVEALWDCTTCGACVEVCPVDIGHVDDIIDMRRHQVLMDAEMPKEAESMMRNIERRGDPWGLGSVERLSWTDGLGFEVPILGETPGAEDAEILFWVGCAGALDERGRRTTQAVARLLKRAGMTFAVLGSRETCTGDPARRAGNEYLFQIQAKSNIATFDNAKVRKIVTSCAHCFNTLANEYPTLGGNYEVLHHTQLLAELVAGGRLVPGPLEGSITLHDPCYLGRHNREFDAPRALLLQAETTEMPRSREQSFCCGAGGAHAWLEETDGTRINLTRADEALATGADVIATACPYCTVMLDDAIRVRGREGTVSVLDVAVLLERSMPS